MTEHIAPMNAGAVSLRISDARQRAGWSLEELAERVETTEEELVAVEHGDTPISSDLLLRVANSTGRSLSWFLEPPLDAVASRRIALLEEGAAGVDTFFDRTLEEIGLSVRKLLRDGLLTETPRPHFPSPANVEQAEDLAGQVRKKYGIPAGPLIDLSLLCEETGLHSFCLNFGDDGNSGAMIEVDEGAGVALINGAMSSRRRRFTLAHELGHWLTGDDFETAAGRTTHTEKMLNAFAAHLLVPRSGIVQEWADSVRIHGRRTAAIRMATRYGVSWSAILTHLKNLDLIGQQDYDILSDTTPSWVEFDINSAAITPTLESPWVSSTYRRAVLSAYSRRELTRDRAVELLFGTVSSAELPVIIPRFRRRSSHQPGVEPR